MSEAQQVVIDREWMRARLFGSDEAVIGSPQAFQAHIIGVCERVASRLEALAFAMHLRAYLSASLSHHGVPGLVAEELARSIRTVRRSGEGILVALSKLHSRSAERPFRVVLMGRTMAGKSTLFEFLSAGDGTRVGDGRQRFTRDACVRYSASMGIDFVDTPGVGAMDGRVDFRVAFEQIPDADLVLWVATDQATQEQTGRALEGLGDIGKPIIVALNCLTDIHDEIGLFDLVNEPERIFGGDAVGNLAPIDRHLARAGAKYLDAIPIHAQAAFSAANDGFDGETARTLLRNSRIAHLVEVLEIQRDRTAPQRRVVSVCDAARLHLLEAGSALAAEEVRLRSIVEASKLAGCDFERRARRRIEDANSELEAAFTDAVARRERWVETVDVDQTVETINESWRAEVQLLEGEIEKSVHDAAERLNEDLHAIAADVADDWSVVKPGIFGDLGGYGEAWGNRALKVGGRLGLIAVGALLGSTIPGLGTVMGALVGGLISAAVQLPGAKAWDWVVDRLFRSPEQVRARRRTQVRSEFVPLIDGLRNSLTELRTKVIDSWAGVPQLVGISGVFGGS